MSGVEAHRFLTVPRPRLTKFRLALRKYTDGTKQLEAVGKIENIRLRLELEVLVWRRPYKARIGSDVKPDGRWTFTTGDGALEEWGTFQHRLLAASELPHGWESWDDEEIIGVLQCRSIDERTPLSSVIDYDEAAFPSLLYGVESPPLEA
jgi:hypothetical protein